MSRYRYNHSHDVDSIREVLKTLATKDASQDCRKAKAPGELADMVSQGMTRMQQLVQQQPAPQYHLDSSKESDNAATTTDIEGPTPRRGRSKQKQKNKITVAAPPPLPRLDHRRPQFKEKGPHRAGLTAAKTEYRMTVRNRKITPRDASMAQNMAGTD